MDLRRILFPPLGERVYLRRPWLYSRVPVSGWAWYAQEAWTSAAAIAFAAVCAVPAVALLVAGHGRTAARLGFGFLVLFAVAAVVQPIFFRPRVRVSSRLPARVAAGETFETVYEVANLSRRRTVLDLAVETLIFPNPLELRFRPAFVACLLPGGMARCAGRCRALRRGRYRLQPLRVESTFPFGLVRCGRTDWSERLLSVVPAHVPLVSLAAPAGPRSMRGLSDGARAAREALDFRGTRDYLPGDDPRTLHPRSSARAGRPIVREYEADGPGRIALFADTWLAEQPAFSAQLPRTPPEAALSLAAAAAERLAVDGREIAAAAVGPDLAEFGGSAPGAAPDDALGATLDALAAAQVWLYGGDTLPALAPRLADAFARAGAAMLLLSGWNRVRADLVADLSARGVAWRAVLATPRGAVPDELPAGVSVVDARDVFAGRVVAL
jgi:uncharacterized protein (DUF58 family)